MADEANTSAPVDAPVPTTATDPTESASLDGENAPTKQDEDIAGKQATTEVTAPDGDGTTEVAVAPGMDANEATSASAKKEKRKSGAGVPEHKAKKLNKKKSMPKLNLGCKPGEVYWARLKGYPPWPAIICDEQMLPEQLLATRPVSAARPDGSLRFDFEEGGKNSKERTFPIMFLSTNEFSWMVNTSLAPLEPEECNTMPKAKMTKALVDAYKLASEDHDLGYYKGILQQWQEEQQAIRKELHERNAEDARLAEEKAKASEEAAKEDGAAEDGKEKKKKKAPRKSKAADEDVDMEDVEAAPKSSKKRKKDAESDGEGKPKKTPKVTKLNAPKTPNGETPAKKASSKPKKKVVAPKPEEIEEEAKPQMSEEEKFHQRELAILYLRHRLQKGFLARDQAPQESEMAGMADFFSQLENYHGLEGAIIRTTKIHKVLKAIVKLTSIPKDEEYNFKRRSADLLEIWNKGLEGDVEPAPSNAAKPKSAQPEDEAPVHNDEGKAEAAVEAKDADETHEGTNETEEKAEQAVDAIEEKATENPEKSATAEPVATASETLNVPTDVGNDTMDEGADGDVSMMTAPEEPTEVEPETEATEDQVLPEVEKAAEAGVAEA